ncbi:hypothetical protein K491DRAFT_590423 [Lophiostoma macrostomum CBS 122681]|uniref:Circumsporozoite protein n=1 Tax=Lophiostoma macrostomum CBS 122681 TaxID=1314788 RepID=A0A6A6TK63_9PLEO|nr:hypothetical protein K491DRAFT_590423 [Lophiostoma macrostomum CBS 122681]
MISKTYILAALIAYTEARFGQEQVPIQAISQVQGGLPGQAATIAGGAISNLLGAANSCDKLATADKIVADLGGGADAIAAAIGMVTAEKNTNPFANNNAQKVCADATLPATAELRGITPLIDPAAAGAADVNALSASSAAAPLDATGLSVFDLISQAGFGDSVVAENSAGGAGAAAGGVAGNAGQSGQAGAGAAGNATADAGANAGQDDSADDCAGDDAATADNSSAADNSTASAGQGSAAADGSATSGASAAAGGASSIAGADFGKCTPTIIFEAGQPGRKADEFTFQIADTLARGGQQDALNPNIITNALCNQLTNVCGANAAALAACADGKAQVSALGTRDKNTADTFNAAVGFAGAVTNPDGGPADVSAAAATNAARAMRYGRRHA